MKQIIATPNAPAAVGPYSQAVLTNNTLYLSGQIGINPATQQLVAGVEAQTKQVFSNIEAVLSEAGYALADLVKVTVFITDMDNFAKVNEVYASFLQAPYPARSCVAVAALPKGALVEIEVVAVK